MLPLNKLGLQLGLIDEDHEWSTLPGANQDYTVVSTALMQITVVRNTENTYDVAFATVPELSQVWDRPKKIKLGLKISARTLVGLADSILKRLVIPLQPSLTRAWEGFQQEEFITRMANAGIDPLLDRYDIEEANVVRASVGNHVSSFYMEVPEAAIHVIGQGDGTVEGSATIRHLSLSELEEIIKQCKIIKAKRWMSTQLAINPQPESTTSSMIEDSSPLASEDLELETSTLEDESISSN